MRNRLFLCLVAAAGLIAASAAQAGTLTMASWSQITQGVPMDRTLTALGAAGTSTATSIAVTLAYPAFSFQTFIPKTANGVLDLHVKITQGGPQALTATPAMAGVDVGIPGTVVVMTANHVGMGVNQSMFNPGINTLVAVPVSIGQAGQFTGSFIVLGITHTITVDFFAWTPGGTTFTGLTTKGVALPTVMANGSFALSAGGGGTVTLVSPSKISIDGSLAQRRTASFTTLKLTFAGDVVPEPGTLLLLGAGALGLALVGSRKR
jgi:PEP-CTERM motif-containing protein